MANIIKERIKIDIFTKNNEILTNFEGFQVRIRNATSSWNFNKPKIKIRVSSKDFVEKVKKEIENPHDIKDYLMGLFDAQASVDINGRIEFKQKNSKKGRFIVERAFKFLEVLDIKSTTIKIKKDNRNYKTDIYFYVTDLEKYQKLIGFTDQEKLDKVNILINIKNNGDNMVIPNSITGINKWEIMKKYHIPYWKLKRGYLEIKIKK